MTEKSESGVMLRSMLFGSIILGLLVVLAVWIDEQVGLSFPRFEGKLYGGLILFFLWTCVARTLQRANRVIPTIDVWRLIIIGVFVAIVGMAMGAGFNRLAANFQENWETFALTEKSMLFYSGMGLIASVIALVNLRIRNKFLGNILELLIIGALIYAFYHFMI